MKKIAVSLFICAMLLLLIAVPVMAASTLQEAAPQVEVTPLVLGGIAGTVLSLLFGYFPGLNVKFAGLSPDAKRRITLGVLLLTSFALYGLRCTGVIDTVFSCDRGGVIQLLTIFFMAVISNQSAYSITPLPAAVKVAAAESKATSDASAQVEVLEKALDEHDVQSHG